MNTQVIRKILLLNGVKNLKEFGYPDVTIDNILTDIVYSLAFKGMLKDWSEIQHEETDNFKQQKQQAIVDAEIQKLLTELQAI